VLRIATIRAAAQSTDSSSQIASRASMPSAAKASIVGGPSVQPSAHSAQVASQMSGMSGIFTGDADMRR